MLKYAIFTKYSLPSADMRLQIPLAVVPLDAKRSEVVMQRYLSLSSLINLNEFLSGWFFGCFAGADKEGQC